MKRGDFATADLRLPEWTDGMPGHTVIAMADLAASFGMNLTSLEKAIDRGDFPQCDKSGYEVNASSRRKGLRFIAPNKSGARTGKRHWHLSTVRAWLASRHGT